MKLKNKYKISVIIVCHPGYQEHLKKALKSLDNQTLKDFQVILVLNGYDEIPEITSRHNLDIYRTPSTNLATACNAGINASSGEYIIRMDADDWFHPEILRFEYDVLEFTKKDAVYCDFYRTENDEITEIMEHHTLEHACGVLYKREVFDKLNGYDESLEYQESFDYWLRFFKAGFKARHVNVPLYFYRKHQGSMSTNTESRAKARQAILDKHK